MPPTIAVPLTANDDPRTALAQEAVRTRFALSSFRNKGDPGRRKRVAAHLQTVRISAIEAGLPVLARVLERCEVVLEESEQPFADARFTAMEAVLREIGYGRPANIPPWLTSEEPPLRKKPRVLTAPVDEGASLGERGDDDGPAIAADPPGGHGSSLELVLQATDAMREGTDDGGASQPLIDRIEPASAPPLLIVEAILRRDPTLLEALVAAVISDPDAEAVHDTIVDAPVAPCAGTEGEAADLFATEIVFTDPAPPVDFGDVPSVDVVDVVESTVRISGPPPIHEEGAAALALGIDGHTFLDAPVAPRAVGLTPPPRPLTLLALSPPPLPIVPAPILIVDAPAASAEGVAGDVARGTDPRRGTTALTCDPIEPSQSIWAGAPAGALARERDAELVLPMTPLVRPIIIFLLVILGLLAGLGLRSLAMNGIGGGPVEVAPVSAPAATT